MSTPYLTTSLGSGDYISSSNIVWQGPNIPCIELCEGDNISTVVYQLATHICSLVSDVKDLETLDLTCIQGLCGNNFTDFTLKSIVKLLLDNDCALKDLIDALTGQIDAKTGVLLNLDLKCFTQDIIDICGILPVSLEVKDVLQVIINKYCVAVNDIATLQIDITNLRDIIDPILNKYYDPNDPNSCLILQYVEPLITLSPLNNGTPLVLHEHITQITDTAIKNLQDKLGTAFEFSQAVSAGCYSKYPALNASPTNMFQVLYNNDTIICDLLNRIESMELSCLRPSCNDLHLGFVSTLSGTVLSIQFSYQNGTNIPVGFQDIGSTIIITDILGSVITTNTLTQLISTGSTFVVDINGLDLTNVISIQIKSSFQYTIPGNTYTAPSILKCDNCFNGNFRPSVLQNNQCWSFEIPTLSSGGSFKFNDLIYWNNGILNSVNLVNGTLNDNTNTGVFAGVLPSGVTLTSYNPINSTSSLLLLNFKNLSTTISPMIGVTEVIGTNSYNNSLYIKGIKC